MAPQLPRPPSAIAVAGAKDTVPEGAPLLHRFQDMLGHHYVAVAVSALLLIASVIKAGAWWRRWFLGKGLLARSLGRFTELDSPKRGQTKVGKWDVDEHTRLVRANAGEAEEPQRRRRSDSQVRGKAGADGAEQEVASESAEAKDEDKRGLTQKLDHAGNLDAGSRRPAQDWRKPTVGADLGTKLTPNLVDALDLPKPCWRLVCARQVSRDTGSSCIETVAGSALLSGQRSGLQKSASSCERHASCPALKRSGTAGSFEHMHRSGPILRRQSTSSESELVESPVLSRLVHRVSREQAVNLEEALTFCEDELRGLESRMSSLAVLGMEAGRAAQPPSAEEGMGDGHSNGCSPCSPRSDRLACLQAWRSDCQATLARLEVLAADALERGCDRSTPGAMDIFEQANVGVEKIAVLLKQCDRAEVEARAPEYCDELDWRWATAATRGSEERAALHQMVELVQDLHSQLPCTVLHPTALLRFLRAQKGDSQRAAEMFRESVRWRASSGIERRLQAWQAETSIGSSRRARVAEKCRVHCDIGTDRYGMPVLLFRWSAFDAAGLERELGVELMLDVIVGIHEQVALSLHEAMLKTQGYVPGALLIWDVGNYGRRGVPNYFSRMWALVRFLPKVARILEQNYPEVVRRVMVVRCGRATKALYHAAAPFLPAGTLAKCQLYGWHAEEWRRDLEAEMPGACFPAFLACDDEEVLAAAEPKGGICPVGIAEAERLFS